MASLIMADQDMTYLITEDVKSKKTDISKMQLEVKKISQLPPTVVYDILQDSSTLHPRDVIIFGHEDGSMTF